MKLAVLAGGAIIAPSIHIDGVVFENGSPDYYTFCFSYGDSYQLGEVFPEYGRIVEIQDQDAFASVL